MLPFFEPKKQSGVIVMQKGKLDLDASPEVEAPGSEMDPGLKAAAEDILRAIEAKSPMDLAMALKAAYEVCESYDMSEDME